MTLNSEGNPTAKDSEPYLLITAIQAHDLPPTNNGKNPRAFVEINDSSSTQKTSVFKARSRSPAWEQNMLMNVHDLDVVLSFSVYHRHGWIMKELLGTAECPLSHLGGSGNDNTTLPLTLPSSDSRSLTRRSSGSLTITYQNNTRLAAAHVLASSAHPGNAALSPLFGQTSSVKVDVTALQSQLSTLGPLLQSIGPVKNLFDQLAAVHPFASAAWGLLSCVYDILKAQNDADTSIINLYGLMLEVYNTGSKGDLLQNEEEFHDLFEAMIKQTTECAIFISGYAPGSYLRRLTSMNISAKVEQFSASFADLETKFQHGLARKTGVVSLETNQNIKELVVISLGTREALKILDIKNTLDVLKPAASLGPKSSCLQGTRIETLNLVVNWIAMCNAETLWLKGLAGTGKSTIMGSLFKIALEMGANNRLGAFIRFDRAEFNDAAQFVTSLAYELAQFDARIAEAIAKAISNNPRIVRHPEMSSQFSALILGPLKSLEQLKDEGPIIILIDGLDECEDNRKRGELLNVLAAGFGSQLPFIRLVITSRPEKDIQHAFSGKKFPQPHTLALDTQSPAINQDIHHYFEVEFAEIESPQFRDLCKEQDAISQLTERASGLFIWASTICQFIKQYPVKRLPRVLDTNVPPDATGALTALYQTALTSVVAESGGEDIRNSVRAILGAVILAKGRGITLAALDGLIFHDEAQADELLQKLGSVATTDDDGYVQLLHKSFYDFLQDGSRCGEWYVDLATHTKNIATSCLKHLNSYLDSTTSGSEGVDLPALVVYAFQCWHLHVADLLESSREVNNHMHRLFRVNFLKWLEELHRHTSDMTDVLLKLRLVLSWTHSVPYNSQERKLIRHAWQFVERYIDDIKLDPTFVYLTALAFSPQSSLIRSIYSTGGFPSGKVIREDVDRLLWLSSATASVDAVSFSSDGSQIVLFKKGGDYVLRDPVTGALLTNVPKLRPKVSSIISVHKGGNLVAHTLDGSKFAMVLSDDVQVRDTQTATVLFELSQADTGGVNLVAFSPDGSMVISGSAAYETIQIWDSAGKSILEPGAIHAYHGFSTAALSPDLSKLVSTDNGGTIRVWDVRALGPHIAQASPKLIGQHSLDSRSSNRDGAGYVSTRYINPEKLAAPSDPQYAPSGETASETEVPGVLIEASDGGDESNVEPVVSDLEGGGHLSNPTDIYRLHLTSIESPTSPTSPTPKDLEFDILVIKDAETHTNLSQRLKLPARVVSAVLSSDGTKILSVLTTGTIYVHSFIDTHLSTTTPQSNGNHHPSRTTDVPPHRHGDVPSLVEPHVGDDGQPVSYRYHCDHSRILARFPSGTQTASYDIASTEETVTITTGDRFKASIGIQFRWGAM